jgi:hypothetical protein
LWDVFTPDYFFDVFLYIFCDLKLEFELAYEKLKDAILFNLFADFVGAVDADAGEYPDEIDHIDCVNVGVVADVW